MLDFGRYSDSRVPGAVQHASDALQTRDPGFLCAMKEGFSVYILASRYRGTMYVGVTSDLGRRMSEHKVGVVPGFTKTYNLARLVYAEPYPSILDARAREHTLKRWRREWKFALIEKGNPAWRDLSELL